MPEHAKEWASRESARTGRSTHDSVDFRWRDGGRQRVRYMDMGRIQYHPADYGQGENTEALAIQDRTTGDVFVIKGYNLERVYEQLDERTLGMIAETRQANILRDKQNGVPIFTGIEMSPLYDAALDSRVYLQALRSDKAVESAFPDPPQEAMHAIQ